ncbi:hypothetical protein QEZ54_34580 [Catellatospora sp. KI3]|uniref:hypothetical protein n=1 Tax=Catellatospora sp. KI3 TaxID=3041620 RepID=UPI002482CEB4|nr:hypothetical protein [Catellatospora sp. KI3]MDI1466114.1 hypothetical protein [Catellatospora sp. KI3]
MSPSRSSKPYYLVLGIAFLATVAYVLTVVPGRSALPPVQAAAPSPSPSLHGDGLSDSHDGYLIRAVALPEKRGRAIPVAFQILGPDGRALTEYEPVQTKLLHLYLVRDDLSGYQHLHPELRDGTWTTAVDIGDGGAYRFYAEFLPKGRGGHTTTLGLPFVITGDTRLAPLPAPAPDSRAGAYTVHRLDGTAHLRAGRSGLLRFDVPGAVLEPYLGALAHMSAFEVRTQALTHLHPAADELTFHVQFPNRGEYRLFMDFQVAGKPQRAAFTVFVT